MANTLKLGAGKWATGTDTVLAFTDENNNIKPLPFDFSRASSATIVNQSGLIETVGSGTPRIDFLGNTKGALLLEPQRTNSLPYSQDFSNSGWNTSTTRSVDFVPTSTIDPQGQTNAYKVTSTASDNQVAFLSPIASGQAYTNSIYVKRVSGSGNVLLRDVNNSATSFTLNDIDGWKRISVTTTSTSGNGRLYINLFTIGDSIEIWGAQTEQGSYPTSYIPTSGSAVTRVKDDCNQTTPDGVIGQTEGTLYLNISALSDDATNRRVTLSDGTATNRMYVSYKNYTNQIRVEVISAGSSVFDSTYSSSDITANSKIALAYKSNDFAFYVDGTQVSTDTSGAVPTSLTAFKFEDGSGGNTFFGNVKQAQLYNTRLSNAELASLTTI